MDCLVSESFALVGATTFNRRTSKRTFFLFGELDFENYLRVGLKEIGETIGIQLANVARAMKKLKDLEIIIEGPPASKFKTYQLNPYITHKGSDRKDTIYDFDSVLESKNQKISDEDLQ